MRITKLKAINLIIFRTFEKTLIMKVYFTISEYNNLGAILNDTLIAKIQNHIDSINPIRAKLGKPVIVSSGYRTLDHELKRKRNGKSQHVFLEEGAADYTCKDPSDTKKLRDLLISEGQYTRVCYYPNNNFIHCDFRSDEKQYFECKSPTSPWEFIKTF